MYYYITFIIDIKSNLFYNSTVRLNIPSIGACSLFHQSSYSRSSDRLEQARPSIKNIKSQTTEHRFQIILVVEIFYWFYWCWCCCYEITTRSFSVRRRGISSRGRTNRSRSATLLLWRRRRRRRPSPFDEPVSTADVPVIAIIPGCLSSDLHRNMLPFRSLT